MAPAPPTPMSKLSYFTRFRSRHSIIEGGEILMSWKSITCVAVMCALMASQALADPTIHVDLRRNANGNPILNANGNFEWIVTVAPDPTRFVTPGVGAENAG